MQHQATWRALAVTYAVVAAIQLYLAVSMGVTWAWVLTAFCGTASAGFGAAGYPKWSGPDDPGAGGPPAPEDDFALTMADPR
jgi:hypothetical protein